MVFASKKSPILSVTLYLSIACSPGVYAMELENKSLVKQEIHPIAIPNVQKSFERPSMIELKHLKQGLPKINKCKGKSNCMWCSISGYLWTENQTKLPQSVRNEIPTEPNFEYTSEEGRLLHASQSARLLKSQSYILIDEDEVQKKAIQVDDNFSVNFKGVPSKNFMKYLSELPLKKFNRTDLYVGGMIYLINKNPDELDHFLHFYGYKKEFLKKPVFYVCDAQPGKIYTIHEFVTKYLKAFEDTIYIWHGTEGDRFWKTIDLTVDEKKTIPLPEEAPSITPEPLNNELTAPSDAPEKRPASRVFEDTPPSKKIKIEPLTPNATRNLEEEQALEERRQLTDLMFNSKKNISKEEADKFLSLVSLEDISLLSHHELFVLLRIKMSHSNKLPEEVKNHLFHYFKRQNPEECEKVYEALFALYMHGIGVEKNPQEAFKYLKLIADQGDAFIQYKVAQAYMGGRIVSKDLEEAIKYFQFAAEQGYVPAKDQLRDCYSDLAFSYCQRENTARNLLESIKYYKLADKFGKVDAHLKLPACYFKLAEVYFSGEQMECNLLEAVKYCKLAADGGHATAKMSLKDCYFELADAFSRGEGMEQNFLEATKYYKLAAERGHTQAHTQLGSTYSRGEGADLNLPEAVKCYKIAAEKGDVIALAKLANAYYRGEGVDRNLPEAFKYYKLAAIKGDVIAQLRTGDCYFIGEGVECNLIEAVGYYKCAAERNHPIAKAKLRDCYIMLADSFFHGEGRERNFLSALNYYKLALDGGDATGEPKLIECYVNVGNAYYYGEGRMQDLHEASRYYQWAFDAGNTTVQTNLSDCYINLANAYFHGHDRKRDLRQALLNYRRAAALGNIDGMINLADCYFQGIGVGRNLSEAYDYYKLAADKGSVKGQLAVGNFYYHGTGSERNLSEAAHYYKLAADQGDALAQAALKNYFGVGASGERTLPEATSYNMLGAGQGDEVSAVNVPNQTVGASLVLSPQVVPPVLAPLNFHPVQGGYSPQVHFVIPQGALLHQPQLQQPIEGGISAPIPQIGTPVVTRPDTLPAPQMPSLSGFEIGSTIRNQETKISEQAKIISQLTNRVSNLEAQLLAEKEANNQRELMFKNLIQQMNENNQRLIEELKQEIKGKQ